jgi:hypothetical protein
MVEMDEKICKIDAIGINNVTGKSRWSKAKYIGALYGIPLTRR